MLFKVPVIAIFTKYDQFRREIAKKLKDEPWDKAELVAEAERLFSKDFLGPLNRFMGPGPLPFICLASENSVIQLIYTVLYCINF
jgi:hypothetical protein